MTTPSAPQNPAITPLTLMNQNGHVLLTLDGTCCFSFRYKAQDAGFSDKGNAPLCVIARDYKSLTSYIKTKPHAFHRYNNDAFLNFDKQTALRAAEEVCVLTSHPLSLTPLHDALKDSVSRLLAQTQKGLKLPMIKAPDGSQHRVVFVDDAAADTKKTPAPPTEVIDDEGRVIPLYGFECFSVATQEGQTHIVIAGDSKDVSAFLDAGEGKQEFLGCPVNAVQPVSPQKLKEASAVHVLKATPETDVPFVMTLGSQSIVSVERLLLARESMPTLPTRKSMSVPQGTNKPYTL